MSEHRLTLKHPAGFFAAGCEMQQALALLSDGAFKIYVYVCLRADRRTAQLRFRVAELAQATGHSTRSLTSYLEELHRAEVALVFRAANQHEWGRIEIRDRFWPYVKPPTATSQEDPEQALYVSRVRSLFAEPACVSAVFSAADEKLAAEWYRAGVPLERVERAILLGCARKYVALFNRGGSPIASLQYFAPLVEELATQEMPLDYWRYLTLRLPKMESQWRAQANSARAPAPQNQETK